VSVYYKVAPVFTTALTDADVLPLDLGNGVRLDWVPPVYSKHVKAMAYEFGRFYTSTQGNLALVKEYDAAFPDEADPEPKGRPRSKSDAAREAIQLASVSLWLAQPIDLSFCLIANLSDAGRPEPIVFPTLRVPPGFKFGVLSHENADEARRINELLSRLSPKTTVYVATRYLWLALHEDAGDLLLAILSIAVEALIGPEDHRQLTVRIPRRGAALLGGDRVTQCLTHLRLSKWWEARCELMHGDTIEHRPDDEKGRLVMEALEVVRQGIRKALLDPAVSVEFATFARRDAYLERIAASFLDPSPSERAAAEASR
jgi:hypothetical protein